MCKPWKANGVRNKKLGSAGEYASKYTDSENRKNQLTEFDYDEYEDEVLKLMGR